MNRYICHKRYRRDRSLLSIIRSSCPSHTSVTVARPTDELLVLVPSFFGKKRLESYLTAIGPAKSNLLGIRSSVVDVTTLAIQYVLEKFQSQLYWVSYPLQCYLRGYSNNYDVPQEHSYIMNRRLRSNCLSIDKLNAPLYHQQSSVLAYPFSEHFYVLVLRIYVYKYQIYPHVSKITLA